MTGQTVLMFVATGMLDSRIAAHLVDAPATRVHQVFADVEHDKVLLAAHAFAANCPEWTANRIIRFFQPKGDKDL